MNFPVIATYPGEGSMAIQQDKCTISFPALFMKGFMNSANKALHAGKIALFTNGLMNSAGEALHASERSAPI